MRTFQSPNFSKGNHSLGFCQGWEIYSALIGFGNCFFPFSICFCDFEKNRKGVGKGSVESLLSEEELWGNKLLLLESKREVT
jgi:hypothetical protein